METKKYGEYITECVRQNLGLEVDDDSRDYDIENNMTEEEVFHRVLEWNGLIGYGYTIRNWIKQIYNIDLDNM